MLAFAPQGRDMDTRLNEYLEESRRLIDAHIDQTLPPPSMHPKPLYQAMRYCVLNGGKRLRAILTLMVSRMLNAPDEAALAPALAVELIHCSSLAIDDLPCMDDAELRRGKPALHKVFPEGISLMAADALMNMSFELISDPAYLIPDDVAVKMIGLLADTIGPHGMVGGQAADLQSGPDSSFANLRYTHMNKTAALFVTAARLGVLAGNGTSADDARISGYARAIGIAFQIVDDILDLTGDVALLGKQPGIDQQRGRMTFVNYYGLNKARRIAENSINWATNGLATYGDRAWTLRALAHYILERDR